MHFWFGDYMMRVNNTKKLAIYSRALCICDASDSEAPVSEEDP